MLLVHAAINYSDAVSIFAAEQKAPMPATNAEMMKTLRRLHGVPFGLPAAKWMLEVGAFFLRTETELIVKSRRVVPERLMREGFTFNYPCMDRAFAAIEGSNKLIQPLGKVNIGNT